VKAEFRQIEHTADVAIEAQAPDLPGLFDRCAAGMFSLIAEGEPVLEREEHPIAAEGQDLVEVLVGFLREIAWLHHQRAFLYAAASFEHLDASRLFATVRGEPADPARHAIVREIKAITYHGLVVERRGEGWYAQVIFDV
jgi:SHS2 domain-containing protein